MRNTLVTAAHLLMVVLMAACAKAPVAPEPVPAPPSTAELIASLRRDMTEANRCEQEAKINQLLVDNCDECFDGWGLVSYSFSRGAEGCKPEGIDPKCFNGADWIGRVESMCGECGIKYSSAKQSEFRSGAFMDLFSHISCSEFYANLARIQQHCGGCVKVRRTN